MNLRPVLFSFASFLSCVVLSSCAMSLRAESSGPPMTLTNSSDTIRVRILATKTPARLSSSGTYSYQLKKGGAIFTGTEALRIRSSMGSLIFGNRRFKGDVAVIPASASDTLRLNGRRYRGALVFHNVGSGRFDVVEIVDLEEYLYGVLPREVGGDWPQESLKAQAVVSRTYVMANRATDPAQRFDVFNDVKHQVYGGLEDEAPAANRAVEETRGEILVGKDGNPVQAFFHSSCGGCTEVPENVWSTPDPSDVFASVPDPFCRLDPYFSWNVELKKSTILAHLHKAGYKMREIQKIVIGKKSVSGRAVTLWVYSSKGKTEIQGNRFRLALGPEVLRSTLLTDIVTTKKTVQFSGHGWGHGVGLCQWGARGRALAGQKYDDILKAYYPKAILQKASK